MASIARPSPRGARLPTSRPGAVNMGRTSSGMAANIERSSRSGDLHALVTRACANRTGRTAAFVGAAAAERLSCIIEHPRARSHPARGVVRSSSPKYGAAPRAPCSAQLSGGTLAPALPCLRLRTLNGLLADHALSRQRPYQGVRQLRGAYSSSSTEFLSGAKSWAISSSALTLGTAPRGRNRRALGEHTKSMSSTAASSCACVAGVVGRRGTP